MERLERLINLVAALLAADRPLTRDELAERVPGYPPDGPAFHRAFERDKDALRTMGIPIATEKVDPTVADSPEGYRVHREQYELPDPDLDADELAALHLAVSAVRMDGGDATAAIWKLGGDAQAAAEGAEVALAGSEHLPVLFRAVTERRPVGFGYRDAARLVDPWRLTFRTGRWHLIGYDHDRGEERQFRLDRMDGVTLAGEAGAFERPAATGADPAFPWQYGDEPEVEARLAVDAGHADWAVRYVGPEAVAERRDDGTTVLGLLVRNRDAFRSFALGFLDHAEVLSPPELRDDLVAWLEAIAGGQVA
ncbi:MAG TPA: WYL domain-containing protein [Acidimicrobiales bacterium]|nr:WYL domain-containing protein [Acidimicrobiales bacterium]